ncbi:MAG: HAMP domain-containing histidine kinase [Planctomycetes bacterium]|nr:HAMP domain-containing histidine kinase [Planctomycetota bacterium]
MKIPLRLTLVLAVALANLGVFTLAAAWTTPRLEKSVLELQHTYLGLVAQELRTHIRDGGTLWSGGLLPWHGWDAFDDALVVHLPELTDPSRAGEVHFLLNPVGSSQRGLLFPQEEILDGIRRASREGRVIPVGAGLAKPIQSVDGRPWGGVWVVSKQLLSGGGWMQSVWPWFLGSVLLLTGITYVVANRLLLAPIRRLTLASDRVASGDFAARVETHGRADELGHLMQQFNAMADEVEGFGERLGREVRMATDAVRRAEAAATTQKRLAATGELAAGIAHEINNPLGGMLNAVEVLQRPETDEKKRARYLELVGDGLRRVQHIVGAVLRLAPRSGQTGPVRIVDTLSASFGLVLHRLREQRVQVLLRSEDRESRGDAPDWAGFLGELPTIHGQADELGQCWLNLWVNAMHALAERYPDGGGTIQVTVEAKGTELLLEWKDDGPGVTADVLVRVADPFFSTKDVGQGTGLGLSFVHQTIDGHGGRVEFLSEPGDGFCVRIRLPIWREKSASGYSGAAE